MTGYVVDGSIVVMRLVTEDWSEESSRLLDAGVTLLGPELVADTRFHRIVQEARA
ncbi:MAG: hypothetical protein OXH04_22130 [Acidobacteria bacterium]|nr:hypothetical protein [Acidobacteriota bacterium]